MEEKQILAACHRGNIDEVRRLLATDPRLASTSDANGESWEEGTSTLTLSCGKGALDIVRMLVGAGADVNQLSKDGTPLLFAAFAGHPEVARYLLEVGADPNLTSPSGESPLHAAAVSGHAEICELLIQRGANPNVRTTSGTTDLISTSPPVSGESPLHLAVAYGHVHAVKALLDNGATKELEDHTGQSPFTGRAGIGEMS